MPHWCSDITLKLPQRTHRAAPWTLQGSHWALPVSLTTYLRPWTKGPVVELFTSPLNCYPDASHTDTGGHRGEVGG
eukprot:CAMPEP_0117682372 /NCGR_PEP_ID=MMETSP0804-20121206/19612_1 /TAXON_ID=1074897 /ORGANISM="Tetraselmis astigmatica, Strain CCMP880" /LENGTH=75 /DNA_ID=CAMNT_0005492455 /DNA_START=25 /DNA_END=250 /DNA_ORIENTATION=+